MWTCSFLDISASVPWGVYGRKGRGKWAINQLVTVYFMRQPCPAKYPVMARWTMASRVKALPKGPRSANMNQPAVGVAITGQNHICIRSHMNYSSAVDDVMSGRCTLTRGYTHGCPCPRLSVSLPWEWSSTRGCEREKSGDGRSTRERGC